MNPEQCCELDHDKDGNYHIHSSPGVFRNPQFNEIKTYIFTVHGSPGPQGSKVLTRFGSMHEMSKKVGTWRTDVKVAFLAAYPGVQRAEPGPVELTITFYMKRPKKPKSGYPITRPDLSKLVRSTEDALTEMGAYHDDSNIVDLIVRKRYATNLEGATIMIRRMEE